MRQTTRDLPGAFLKFPARFQRDSTWSWHGGMMECDMVWNMSNVNRWWCAQKLHGVQWRNSRFKHGLRVSNFWHGLTVSGALLRRKPWFSGHKQSVLREHDAEAIHFDHHQVRKRDQILLFILRLHCCWPFFEFVHAFSSFNQLQRSAPSQKRKRRKKRKVSDPLLPLLYSMNVVAWIFC